MVTNSEESTFWLLKVLVENILPNYYTMKMVNLITDIDVLSELIRIRVPDAHKHIADLGECLLYFRSLATEKLEGGVDELRRALNFD